MELGYLKRCGECLRQQHRGLGLLPLRQRSLCNDGVRTDDCTLAGCLDSTAALTKDTYTADPKYKKYAQQVERCLSSFDKLQDWADCIAFIKQLLKVFPRTPERVWNTHIYLS